MSSTDFGVNDALAVKLWSRTLSLQALDATDIKPLIGDDENAVIQMKTETMTSNLRMNHSGPSGAYGPCQPAKKSVTISPESTIMFTYSAIWKRPQRMPEYSVW